MGVPAWPPVVASLASAFSSDDEFLKRFMEAQRDREAADDPWKTRTVAEVLEFFAEWHNYVPILRDERKYIDDFRRFYAQGKGHAVITEPSFRRWLQAFVRSRGSFLDSRESTRGLESWIRAPEVGIEDYIVPEGGFGSFNEFFTRRLRAGARPLDGPDDQRTVVSPADCIMDGRVALVGGAAIAVKGMSLDAAKLLQDSALAARFANGKALLLSLAPHHYHHFHAPIAARVIANRLLPGLYFGTVGFEGFFTEHHRGIILLDSSATGIVGLVTVGIADISSIVHACHEGHAVAKGERLGHFAYGGSAIVMMFEPDAVQIEVPDKQVLSVGRSVAVATVR